MGGGYDEAERYFEPTILYPVVWTDTVMQGEIFGPILPILRYSNLHEAITQLKLAPSHLPATSLAGTKRALTSLFQTSRLGAEP